jgi:hypothetical protein
MNSDATVIGLGRSRQRSASGVSRREMRRTTKVE